MLNIADYYRADLNAMQKGFEGVNALRQNVARAGAGSALAAGDFEGAAKALYRGGEVEAGVRVQGIGESRKLAAVKAKSDQEEDIYKFSGDMASRLSTILDHNKDDPASALNAFDQYFAPQLARRGETPDEILQMRTMLEKDPRQAVFTLGAGVASEKGYEIVKGGDGSYVAVDPKSGKPVYQFSAPRTVNVAEGGALYELPGYSGTPGGDQAPPAGPRLTAQPAAPAEASAPVGGSVEEMQTTLSSVLPGARFTSGLRTPERNRAVGGAANSYHLKGQALDIVPPAGITTAQAAQVIRASGQYAEVIDEGDHVHVAWGGGSAPAPLAVGAGQDGIQDGEPKLLLSRPKPAKPRERRMTAEEVAAAGYQPGSVVMTNPETGEETVKQGPGAGSGKITDGMRNVASYANDMFSANDQMNELANRGVFKPTAQVLVSEQNGVTRLVARNPKDTQFVQAANAWLIPLLRKETGAAVTASELTVYMDTYIPLPSDDDETVRQKAAARRGKMLSLLKQSRPAFEDQFGEIPKVIRTMVPPEKGRAKSDSPVGAIRSVRTLEEARALPPGTRFRTPDGRVKVR